MPVQNYLDSDIMRNYSIMPNVVCQTPSLSPYEKLVWLNFLSHLNRSSGDCFPSRERQAREIGCSAQTVSKARVSLVKKGWIDKSRDRDDKGRLGRYRWSLKYNDTTTSATPGKYPLQGDVATNSKNIIGRTEKSKRSSQIVDASGAGDPKKPAVTKKDQQRINSILDAFYEVNPTLDYVKYRSHVKKLVKKFGYLETLRMAEAAAACHGVNFAPTITDPKGLYDRWSQLTAYLKKQASRGELPEKTRPEYYVNTW